MFTDQFAAHGLELIRVMELSSTEAIKEAVATGLGLAVVSRLSILTDLCVRRIAMLEVSELHLEWKLHLARHKSKRLSLAGAAFLNFLRDFKAFLPGTPSP